MNLGDGSKFNTALKSQIPPEINEDDDSSSDYNFDKINALINSDLEDQSTACRTLKFQWKDGLQRVISKIGEFASLFVCDYETISQELHSILENRLSKVIDTRESKERFGSEQRDYFEFLHER